MGDGARRPRRLRLRAAGGGLRDIEGADRGLDPAVPDGCGAAFVRHHVDRHLHGHDRALDAAVRAAADARAAAAPVAVRRDDPAREHARVRANGDRSEEHTSELQSLMRISYAVFCLKKKKQLTTLPVTT